MGVCLCKDTIEDLSSNEPPQGLANSGTQTSSSNCGLESSSYGNSKSLPDTVDRLVKETLEVIGTIVDNEPEPPNSMVLLHVITDKPSGWIELVRSLIRVVPVEHPMGPSVIALLLDDSPLPTKGSVLEVSSC